MRDILSDLSEWVEEEDQIALATVIQTWGSSPRSVGAKMALTPEGKITGSVSGGCIEGAVFEAGVEVLKSERLDRRFFDARRKALLADRPHAVATVIEGSEDSLGREVLITIDEQVISTFDNGLEKEVITKARKIQTDGHSQRFTLEPAEGSPIEVFVEVIQPAPTLVIVGGVHIAITLTSIAKSLGFRTVVVDPRRSFGSSERFPHVDQLIQAWPQEAFSQINLSPKTAVAMLTHDPKIDDPALQIALNSPAFYIGALGSQKTQARRRQRLLDAGLTQKQLERLHGPIGLDIGGETPEEIALAVMAEVVAAQHGGEHRD